MGYTKDRDEFIATMAKEGLPLDATTTTLRLASSYHRIQEAQCNGPVNGQWSDEWQATMDKRETRIELRLQFLLAPHDVKPIFQGDPRGATVKLKVPSGATNDWRRQGICVPTRS